MIRFLAAVFLFHAAASAQIPNDPARTFTLHGRVITQTETHQSYVVQLASGANHLIIPGVSTDLAGEFHINGLSSGQYSLTVTDSVGRILQEGFVNVVDNVPLEIRLQPAATARPPSGAISVAKLRHKVPGKAAREFNAAKRARRTGDIDQALAHLLNATRIDPDFMEAHNNIAAALIDLKRFDEAMRELDRAAELDPTDALVNINRAVCLSRMGDFAEAEVFARRAVELDPVSPQARHALAMVLFQEQKFTPETIDNLERSSEAFPAARLTAAYILVQSGRQQDACVELKRYLETGQAEHRAIVQGWLARLTATPQR
jgi:tetratricopeptide (TPR) repeat protein